MDEASPTPDAPAELPSVLVPRQGPVRLSVVVPMHDEAPALDAFFEEVERVLEDCAEEYEIVCVNDGSRDETLPRLLLHHRRNPRIVVVDLTRNFGKEQALTAGIEHATLDAVIPLDADLQDPPEVIRTMVERWQEGWDVIYGTRADRGSDSWLKRTTADWFYRCYNALAEVPIPANTGDFRLLDRTVVDALAHLQERNRFLKGLFAWVGFRQTTAPYVRRPRVAGVTKWGYWRLWNFALDGITASTTLPLRLASYFGLLVSAYAILHATFLIVRTLVLGVDVPGYASLMVVQLLMGGVQLVTLGVLGEYLGRVYQESKARPPYLVRRVFPAGGAAGDPAAADRGRE